MQSFEEGLAYNEYRERLIERIYEGDKIYFGPNEYIDHRDIMNHCSVDTWEAMHKALRAMANDCANPSVRDTGVARQQFLTAYNKAVCELIDLHIDDIERFERRENEKAIAESDAYMDYGRASRLLNRRR